MNASDTTPVEPTADGTLNLVTGEITMTPKPKGNGVKTVSDKPVAKQKRKTAPKPKRVHITIDGVTVQVDAKLSNAQALVAARKLIASKSNRSSGDPDGKNVGTTAPSKQKKTTTTKKYPAEISESVRLAKIARGTTNGAPGAKQHVLVRKEIAGLDAKGIVKAAGLKSELALRRVADGTSTTEDLKALRPLAAKFDDPFCKSRNLASILVAAIDQMKAAK